MNTSDQTDRISITSDIFELSSQVVDTYAALNPLEATGLGLVGFDAQWPDLSPAGFVERRVFWADTMAAAEMCEAPDRRCEVAKRVLIDECLLHLATIDSDYHLSDVNNLVSPWQEIRTIFALAPTDTAQAWADTATRLETIEDVLASYQESLIAGQTRGLVAARRQILSAISQGQAAAGDESSFNEILSAFNENASNDRAIEDLRTRIEAGVQAARMAYGSMTDWFESTQLPAAPEADGVGRDRYVEAAKRFLGETIDPEATYAWGWQEVARLQAELATVCAEIDPAKSVAEVMEVLQTDPDRAASSPEEFIAIMQARQEQALQNLAGSHFEVDDRIRAIEVRTAPPGGAAAPYYTPPSEDFSRPGRVWYPIGGRTSFPLFDEVSTAYHEGFPGHHLQVGTQVAMGEELSRFHRTMVWYSGSGEGWALYAERLMGELGYFEKPDYVAGLLTSQLFRSCRIVIDIGCHLGFDIPDDAEFHPGEPWSFELATEMMRTVAHQEANAAESEVTRYMGWPGQAISYKVGEKAIIDLRAEWEAAGDFDLKRFHADLLAVGSIGIDLMRELVPPPS